MTRLGRTAVEIERLAIETDVSERSLRQLRRHHRELTRRMAVVIDDGHLTPGESRELERRLRRLKKRIRKARFQRTPQVRFEKKPNVAQYGGAAWDNVLRRIKNTDAQTCQAACAEDGECTFLFHNSRGNLVIGHHHRPVDHSINSSLNECVLFFGKPWWGSAPQSDGYIKTIDGRPAWER